MNFENDSSLYAVFGQVMRFHYCRIHMLLEKIDVYPGQHPLLFILGKQDGLSQKELAEKLYIKPATITVMLGRLEKSKIIERRSDPNDQRVSRVYLTSHGRKVLAEVKGTLKEIKDECFSNLTAEEQIIMRRLLIQMRDNLMKACGIENDE